MELTKSSCEGFLESLASKAPAPGGGGAAALVGAAGVALGNMVGSLTVGKKKYAAVEADVRALNARAEVLRRRLEALVQADAEAFLPLAAAYGLPKETPEQQAHKGRGAGKQALDGACGVPLEIMEACCEGIALAQEYAAKGSALAVSRRRVCGAVLQGCLTGFGPECLHQYQTDGRPRPRRGPERQGRRTAGTVRPAGRYALRKNGNTIERGSLNGNDLERRACGGRHERSKRRPLCGIGRQRHHPCPGRGPGGRAGGRPLL